MEIEIIEIQLIKHKIKVDKNWPKEAQGNESVAVHHLEKAALDIGFDSIFKSSSEKMEHKLEYNGKPFAE